MSESIESGKLLNGIKKFFGSIFDAAIKSQDYDKLKIKKVLSI